MATRSAAPLRDLGRMGFSEEQADLLEVATRFCRERSPVSTVRRLMTEEPGHDPAVWREMGELGWLGIAIPEAYGGAGLDLAAATPVVEQMGRTLLATPFVSTTLAAQALIVGGTEAQKLALLPGIATGAPATVALAEKEGDWDPEAIQAEAHSDGPSRLKLSGRKILVCDAAVAEWIIVSVRHDGAPALVIVNREAIPAGALRREVIIDETRRSFELDLSGVSVARDQTLDPSRAVLALRHLHLAANLLAAADMCGGAEAVIGLTVDYLKTRKQFGKLIGSYQALKHPVVEAYVRYEQARSHLYSAAHCFGEQGTGEIAVRMAKATADWAYAFASDRAIQFHGGFGFTYDCDAQLYRRRAIWDAAQSGDGAWHKQRLAELLL
jgi:acyl-CoA dehydrogenase